jgi:hypothetical protein
MEETFTSETSADFQRTTRRYIPADRTLRNHRCVNLRSYKITYLACSLSSSFIPTDVDYKFYVRAWYK